MKKVILNIIHRLGFERKKIVVDTIHKTKYKVIKGTIKSTPDNDDAWLFELSKSAKIIFDIGANIGQSAILMLHNNPDKMVLVDPNPKALSFAAENLIHNNFIHKTQFYKAFVSDKIDEEIDFYTVGTGAAGSRFKTFAKTASAQNSYFKVKTLTVDFIAQETQLIPDLIKIDVEGAESEVLNGAIELAKKQKTSFFVEIHSGIELSITENTELILNWCNNNNYKAIYLRTMKPLILNDIKTRGRYHALILPNNYEVPENLKLIKERDFLKH